MIEESKVLIEAPLGLHKSLVRFGHNWIADWMIYSVHDIFVNNIVKEGGNENIFLVS